ncbi:MAG TPA: hypothetical protein VFT06_00305 [Flavisolibacter sp.]|nr:hypothetical protein [Flavisolibacter sp.]
MQQATAVILPLIGVVLAAFSKAVADTLAHHFATSVFKWRDKRFWEPSTSCNYVGFIRFTKYRPDAWHLSNSLQIVSWCAAIAFATNLPFAWWQILIVAGVVFNLVFNLFYNKILKR